MTDLVWRKGKDKQEYQQGKINTHLAAIKAVRSATAEILGHYHFNKGMSTITVWYQQDWGIGAISTHGNGETYACFVNRDRRPPLDDYGSDFETRYRPDKAIRSAIQKTKRAFRLRRFYRMQRQYWDSKRGVFTQLMGKQPYFEDMRQVEYSLKGLIMAAMLLPVSGLTGGPTAATALSETVQRQKIQELRVLAHEATEAFRGQLPADDGIKNLLFFTFVVESGGGQWDKSRTGPETSFAQIKPSTRKFLLKEYLDRREDLYLSLQKLSGVRVTPDEAAHPKHMKNKRFVAGVARIKYATVSESLKANTWEDIAKYWKKHYQAGSSGLSSWEALKLFKEYVE